MVRYALGVDGGGSKCEAALVEETGAVAGWGRGGPTHVYYDPPERVAASYVEAIEGALAAVRGRGEIWVAGPVGAEQAQEAIAAACERSHYLAADEVATSFACAQQEWGLVVLAGTGSFVHARRPDGREVHFGGLGPILNDYGSGYEIGLRGLRAAFASDWTPARRTSLAEAVPRALGAADRRGVFELVYVKGIGRQQMAGLARVVDEEAEAGDGVAAECVRRAADALAELAVEAIGVLGMEGLPFPMIAIGGVAQRSRRWWARVCERVLAAAPGARPVVPSIAPAGGAALLALRAMGVEWSGSVIARLAKTQEEMRARAVEEAP